MGGEVSSSPEIINKSLGIEPALSFLAHTEVLNQDSGSPPVAMSPMTEQVD